MPFDESKLIPIEESDIVYGDRPDNPELLRALEGTKEYRGLSPKESIKPNKWNLRETRTRGEILAADAVSSIEDKLVPIKDEPSQSIEDKLVPIPEESPGFAKSAIQPIADVVGQTGRTLAMAAGGVAGLVNEDAGDAVFKAGDEFNKGASELFMTPAERANQTYAEKAVGTVTGAIPIAVSAWFNPVGTAAVLGSNALFNTTADQLKRGVDLQRSTSSGLIDSVFTTGANLLPGIGKTIPRSIGIGVTTNPAAGFVTDLAIEKMFPDRPDIQKIYDPYDFTKRSLESIGGGVTAIGFHKLGVYQKAQAEKRKAEVAGIMDKVFQDEIIPEMEAAIPGGRVKYSRTTLRDLVEKGDPTGEHPVDAEGNVIGVAKGKLTQALDLITSDGDAAGHQRLFADVLSRLAPRLGLDSVTIEKYIPKDAKDNTAGHYDDDFDIVQVKPDRSTHQKFVKSILHEAVHAITFKGAEIWRKTKPKGDEDPSIAAEFKASLDPHTLRIVEKMDNLNTVFELARTKILEKAGFSDITESYLRDTWFQRKHDQTIEYAQQARGTPEFDVFTNKANEGYGFRDIHEFMSEVMTNPGVFGKVLKEMDINPDQVPFLKTTTPRGIKNMWQAAVAAYKSLLGIPNGSNIYSLAFDHVSGIIESTKASGRFKDLKDVDVKAPTKGLSKVMMHRIAGLAANVHTKEELATRMSIISENKVWGEWVKNNIDRVWNNSSDLFDAAGKTDFGSLPESLQKLAGDDRTLDQFIHEEFPKNVESGKVHAFLSQQEDLKGAGRQLFSPTILNLMKDGFGAKIMRFVNHKAVEYKSMGEILYHKALEHMQDFNDLKQTKQHALMDTIAATDTPQGRVSLQKAGLQWMTDDMLAARGHDAAEIQAYKGMTTMADFLHSLMNQARVKEGKPPIEQIPGYMPHNFPGAYKVLVKLVKAKNKGSLSTDPTEFIVAVRGFKTKYGAQGFIKELKKGKHDTDEGMMRPQIDNETGLEYKIRTAENLQNSLMGGIEDHLTAYRNALVLQPETLQALEKIEADNMRGMTKHALERSDIHGYTGEFGQSTKLVDKVLGKVGLGPNPKQLKIWENYAKNITNYYRNTLFVDEVMSPLTTSMPLEIGGKTHYKALLENTKELNKHLTEFGYNFTGKNVNKADFIDNALQKASIAAGIDPLLYRQTIRGARNLLSMIKLRANLPNYAANTFQTMHIIGLLEFSNTNMIRDGIKVPSTVKTLADALTQMKNPDADMVAAREWAKHNHHLDAQLEYELHDKNLAPIKDFLNKITLGEVNPRIESFGRGLSFTIAYTHFRKVFPDNPDRARDAAVNLMKMTMIDYDSTQRPLMYQNYGSAGESISPFAVFRNGYVGNTLLMFKMAAQQPKKFASWKPLLISQLTYLASAGVLGIIGVGEYNLIVNQANEWFPELEWPTMEELLFKAGWPDSVVFGGMSAATKNIPGMERGMYMGSSMNAISVDDTLSVALTPFLSAIATATGVSTKWVLSELDEDINPPAAGDYYKAQRQLTPGVIQPWVERFHYMHPDSNVAPQTSSLEAGVERKPSDWTSLYIGGKRSIGETRESTENRIIAKKEQLKKNEIKKLVSIAVDLSMGMSKNRTYEDLRGAAARYGMSSEEFAKAVVEGKWNRMLSQRAQEAARKTLEGERQRQERYEMDE